MWDFRPSEPIQKGARHAVRQKRRMTNSCPLRSHPLRAVARWWVQTYQAGEIPSRRQIDHSALRYALPYIWLVEYLQDRDAFRYRLAGEHVNDTFGYSLRGKLLSDVIEPHMLATVRTRYTHALTTPGAVHATGRVYARTGRFREGERLILPLADDGGAATHLLGVTVYHAYGPIESQAPTADVPPEHMDESFLTIQDVLSWRDALTGDLPRAPAAVGRSSR